MSPLTLTLYFSQKATADLPALRTYATRVQELASLERLGEAAPAALVVAAFGLAACQEEATEAASFADLDSCMAAASDGGWFTEAEQARLRRSTVAIAMSAMLN